MSLSDAANTTRRSSQEDQTPLLSEAYWPRSNGFELQEITAWQALERQARANPNGLALVGVDDAGQDIRLSWADLHEASTKVALQLLEIVEPGQHIAVLGSNVAEWPIIEYAASASGLVVAALNPAVQDGELAYTLEHSDAALLLHSLTVGGRDPDASETMLSTGPAQRIKRVSFTEVQKWIREPANRQLPTIEVDPGSPGMIQYTSGTTGRPKGVLLSHRSMTNVARAYMETSDPQPRVMMSPIPMFHTAGCITSTLGSLAADATYVLMPKWNAAKALDLVEQENVDTLLVVTTMLYDILSEAEKRDQVKSIPTIMVGASSVPPSLVRRAREVFNARVIVVYGQTESSAPLTMSRREDSDDDIALTVGRPLPQVEVRVADLVSDETVPVDRTGELCFRGYQQMLEYYKDPGATAATIRDGWVHTGDLATMNERGLITLEGRLKELIIRGGENISPAEIIECIRQDSRVADVSVIGINDERLGEKVVAIVVPKDDITGPLRDDLHALCSENLAKYKVPSEWYLSNALPTTASGKIKGFQLKNDIQNNRLQPLP